MKRLRNLLLCPMTIAGFLLASTTAKAAPVTFTLSAPFQSVAAGGTVTFDATVTNNTNHVIDLNGDSSTLDALLDPSDLSDADYANFPLSLDSGESFSGPLFTVTIPLATLSGIYTGSFEITGGRQSADMFGLGSADFNIDVTGTGAGAVVPEPSSLVLLISGMAGLAGNFRPRTTTDRRASQSESQPHCRGR